MQHRRLALGIGGAIAAIAWGSGRAALAPAEGPAPAAAAPSSSEPSPAARAEPFACPFTAGARPRETLTGAPASLPIKHVIVLTQENRSYDHYFGRLPAAGQPNAEAIPEGFGNRDADGRWVTPFHLPSTCVPKDPPHQWANMHAHWNQGRMDGFVTEAARAWPRGGDADDDAGRFALGYYDAKDLPFYYFLANTFTIADRFFSSAMAGTWPNRQFLYTGKAQSQRAATGLLSGAPAIFDSLTRAGVGWAVYTDGPPRQDCIGWTRNAPGVQPIAALFQALRAGTLPAVSFLDPSQDDEHPPTDVQRGEAWSRRLYQAVTASPLWRDLALFITYDEGGGFFDHVPPPPACPPAPGLAEYNRRGTRVPMLVVSPWARRHHVSHVVHDHASVLRFIELLFDLPALTARDANADALLDAFDFSAPRLSAPPAPAAGRGGCRPGRLVAAR